MARTSWPWPCWRRLQQYRIAGAARGDTAKVKQVLHSVASQTGLVDRTSTSRAQHTLVFYSQPRVQHFRVDLGARVVADDIVVDLTAGFGPTPREFKQAQRLVTPALSSEFGSRITVMPPFTQPIPVTIQSHLTSRSRLAGAMVRAPFLVITAASQNDRLPSKALLQNSKASMTFAQTSPKPTLDGPVATLRWLDHADVKVDVDRVVIDHRDTRFLGTLELGGIVPCAETPGADTLIHCARRSLARKYWLHHH